MKIAKATQARNSQFRPNSQPGRIQSPANRLTRRHKTTAHLRPNHRKCPGPPAWPSLVATQPPRRIRILPGQLSRAATPLAARLPRLNATTVLLGLKTVTPTRSLISESSIRMRKTPCRSDLAAGPMQAVDANAAVAAPRPAAGRRKAAPTTHRPVGQAANNAGRVLAQRRAHLPARAPQAVLKAHPAAIAARVQTKAPADNKSGPNSLRPNSARPNRPQAPAMASLWRSAAPLHRWLQ